MDSIKGLLPALIGPLFNLLGGVISGGPFGAIVGVAGLALMVGGALWVYQKYRNWVFAKTDDKEHKDSANDQANVIKDNQNQSVGDAKTIDQSNKDKDAAKKS